jgi:hypothetical protein
MRIIMASVTAATISLATILGVAPTVAQDVAAPLTLPVVEVTEADVLAACAVEGATQATCAAAVAAYFAYLESIGVVGADLESAVANLVVVLAEANVPPSLTPVVVAAIRQIGTTYATGEQAAAILQIAQAVESGESFETAAISISGA